MQKWFSIRKFLWIIAIPSMLFLCISANNIWLAALNLLFLVALISVYIYCEFKLIKQDYTNKLHQAEQLHLTQLSHQRHDAMNDIQVLFGYITLDKKDKSIEYMDKIKTRARTESAIAKLKDYHLYSYINALKSRDFNVRLDIEHISDAINWNEQYSKFMIAVISCYEKYNMQNELHDQLLSIYLALDDQLHMEFEFNGQLSNNIDWKAEVEEKAAELVHGNRLILNIDEQDINSTFLA